MKQDKNHMPSKETRITVKEDALLMDFLLAKMGGMSRSSVKSLLSQRRVSANGKLETAYNFSLKAGDVVTVNHSKAAVELKYPKLRILYEDAYLIAVEKKEGLLSVATDKGNETTAFSILKDYVKKINPKNRLYVVHRIDRETSGVLLFAKNKAVQTQLQETWQQCVKRRVYVALVEGSVEKEGDSIVSWLREHQKSLKTHSSNKQDKGQQAVSHYRRLKTNETFSLLEVALETGRKNQIRVHMQLIGHPIVGDKKYASTSNPIGRLGLHARLLEFVHPVSGAVTRIESTLPRAFKAVFGKEAVPDKLRTSKAGRIK